jgi:predicted phosphate transport protein (TIGR00153 family)
VEECISYEMGLRDILIPSDKGFFSLLESESKHVLDAANLLDEIFKNYSKLPEYRSRIRAIEHEADGIVHDIYDKLNRTFITPIDREDISSLASRYDDVLDGIYAVVNRLFLYEIDNPTPEMNEFAKVVLDSVKEIDFAFSNMKKIATQEIDQRTIEIDRLENVADDLLNESVGALFHGRDPITIIKLKEIYEKFETITDECEDVANVIRDIAVKQK